MFVTVLAPVAGSVIGIDSVDDEVFSSRMMGDGVAIAPTPKDLIEPDCSARGQQVLAPVTGTVVKARDHAVMIETENKTTVLLHLGLDTHRHAEAFNINASIGESVTAGEPIGTWDPNLLREQGQATEVIVVAMRVPSVDQQCAPGATIAAGELLFSF